MPCRNMMEDKDIEIKDAPKALWDAPFALLSHEFGDSEAKYDYANKVCTCSVCCSPGRSRHHGPYEGQG